MLWPGERTPTSPHFRSGGGQEQGDKSLRRPEREASESNQEGKGANAVRGRWSITRSGDRQRTGGWGWAHSLSEGGAECWCSLEVDSREEQDAEQMG